MKEAVKNIAGVQFKGVMAEGTLEIRELRRKGYVDGGNGFFYKPTSHKTRADEKFEAEVGKEEVSPAPLQEESKEAEPVAEPEGEPEEAAPEVEEPKEEVEKESEVETTETEEKENGEEEPKEEPKEN